MVQVCSIMDKFANAAVDGGVHEFDAVRFGEDVDTSLFDLKDADLLWLKVVQI